MMLSKTRSLFTAGAGLWGRGMSSLAGLDASKLTVDLTTSPKDKLPEDKLTFGNTYTDHMLEVDWNSETGWQAPAISEYHALAIDPAASSLHYALQCFEGMKAYLDADGRVRLFRPEMNMARMNRAMKRLQMPEFDGEQLQELIKQVVLVDKSWIPKSDGYSLYIRPTGISTYPFLGVGPAKDAKIFCIMSPVGPYYPTGFAAISLYADRDHVRAWKHGTGDNKIGSNYGPTIQPQILAAQKGYGQVLWLYGDDDEVTEVGTMNLFMLWEKEDGSGMELVTPPLEDGLILPGVTRQSVLDLAREWGEFDVSERRVTMAEVISKCDSGKMKEVFGCGTAVVVSPVNKIAYKGVDYDIPLDPTDSSSQAGPLTKRMWSAITDIQYGRVEHPWSVVLD